MAELSDFNELRHRTKTAVLEGTSLQLGEECLAAVATMPPARAYQYACTALHAFRLVADSETARGQVKKAAEQAGRYVLALPCDASRDMSFHAAITLLDVFDSRELALALLCRAKEVGDPELESDVAILLLLVRQLMAPQESLADAVAAIDATVGDKLLAPRFAYHLLDNYFAQGHPSSSVKRLLSTVSEYYRLAHANEEDIGDIEVKNLDRWKQLI